jgi:cytochrome bd-type quinol oxidase subunit 2
VSASTLHRIIVSIYVVLSLAALGRSSFQIFTKIDDAPLAYSLSALAAVVYVIATVSVAMGHRPIARRIAQWSLSFELVGVLGVGGLSLILPELFPDQTVWSQFGMGYLFIPLVLPVLGLWWLTKRARV